MRVRGVRPARLRSRRCSRPLPPTCTLPTRSPWWASTPSLECGNKTEKGQTRCLPSPPKLSRSMTGRRSFELRCDTANRSARNIGTCGFFDSNPTADVHGSRSGLIGLVVLTLRGRGSPLTDASPSHFETAHCERVPRRSMSPRQDRPRSPPARNRARSAPLR
jgi:hypothetical protein